MAPLSSSVNGCASIARRVVFPQLSSCGMSSIFKPATCSATKASRPPTCMNLRHACAVVAKWTRTFTPRGDNCVHISPSAVFLPPTRAISFIPISEKFRVDSTISFVLLAPHHLRGTNDTNDVSGTRRDALGACLRVLGRVTKHLDLYVAELCVIVDEMVIWFSGIPFSTRYSLTRGTLSESDL